MLKGHSSITYDVRIFCHEKILTQKCYKYTWVAGGARKNLNLGPKIFICWFQTLVSHKLKDLRNYLHNYPNHIFCTAIATGLFLLQLLLLGSKKALLLRKWWYPVVSAFVPERGRLLEALCGCEMWHLTAEGNTRYLS